MKRAEKINLLTRVLRGETSLSAAKRLCKPLKPLIIVFRPHTHIPQPDDKVFARTASGNATVRYKDLDEYARRVGGIVVVRLPRKKGDG